MYYFTGNNLFGQWIPCGKNVIDQFTSLPCDELIHLNSNFSVRDVKLTYAGWSQNIFCIDNKFFIVGDYKCTGKYIELINIPQECDFTSSLSIISNDYYLIVVNKDTCEYWTKYLENMEEKKHNLTVQVALKSDSKRLKSSNHVLKCVAFNDSLIFLTSNGSVYCGMIPNIMDTSHCKGEPIDIQCGNEHYMLLTTSGTLYTWGNGRRLQLGNGQVNILDVPTEVEALAGIKIVKISAGGWHSLALSEFGDLYAWGWNDTGQLGIKENSNKDTLVSYSLPTLVDIFDESGDIVNLDIKEIACGAKHSAILLDDNSIWTTGNNKYGQVGLPIEENISVHHFKKCQSFTSACELKCGQWSTVVNGIK